MDAFLATIEQSALAGALRRSFVAYPLVNAAHILAVGSLVSTVILMDLRILGLLSSVEWGAFVRLMRRIAFIAFAAAMATGLALFSVRATEYAANPAFLAKMALILAAGVNAAAFRRMGGDGRAFASISLLLWPAALAAGRFIGFL